MPPAHPSEEDREWLEHELSTLLARVGSARFASGPILEPNDRFFPDRYVEGARGVRTVARRLLAWAGLHELSVEVLDESPREDGRRVPTWELELEAIAPGYITLTLLARGKPERLPGALTPLLAEAIRAYVGLDVEPGGDPYRSIDTTNDAELEAELSGVTAVELGWGLLALDAAQRHHSAGEVAGNWHTYEMATEEHGALSIADLAYLLAMQLVVRDASAEERTRVCALLPPNQAALLRAWCDALEREALVERLGITVEPAELAPHVVPEPFDDDDEDEDEGGEPPLERGWNCERPIFRVRTVSLGPSFAGGMLGALTAAPLAAAGVPLGPGVAIGAVLGVLTGMLYAQRKAYDACSDPACEATLAADAARCPRCEGHIAGRIASRARRLEAEEALGDAWYEERGLPTPSSIDDA